MRSNAGFVGFDGTENRRTILAPQKVKEVTANDENLNVLLTMPHSSTRSTMAKFNHLFGTKVSIRGNIDKWVNAGIKAEGYHGNFFEASDQFIIRTLGYKKVEYIEYILKHCGPISPVSRSVKLPGD